jgi:hypothetical protein
MVGVQGGNGGRTLALASRQPHDYETTLQSLCTNILFHWLSYLQMNARETASPD